MEQTHSPSPKLHIPLRGLFAVSNTKELGVENKSKTVEIILLGNEPTKESIPNRAESAGNLKVIELSDRESKMALLRQLNLDSPTSDDLLDGLENYSLMDNNRGVKDSIRTYVLPPGTILEIRDTKKDFQHEIENQEKPSKEMLATMSGANNSTSGASMENSKQVQRRKRRKKKVEVRRNPTRVSKKNLHEDFVNPRLISLKRKEIFIQTEPAKRPRLSSTPYMNTRSVTRKLYNEGAVYQAPTIQDSIEWKEWPDHGMHERPFVHPTFGLGVECNGRFFKSLDGRSFSEIHQESDLEVIPVDPRDQIMESLCLETYMHTMLHSVLAYCAQASDPTYHTTSQNKVEDLKIKSCEKESTQEKQDGFDLQNDIETESGVDKKTPIEVDSLEINSVPIVLNKEETQSGEIPLAQLENQKPSTLTNDQLFKPTTRELNFELGKLDDPAISDGNLMKTSSMYEKLVSNEDPNSEHFSTSLLVQKDDFELKNSTTQSEVQDSNWNKNQTSEIAKILSEYVQSISKAPKTENCVLQSEANPVNISNNDACCNDQKKCEEKSKMSKSKGLPKSRVSASNKNNILETKDIVRNIIKAKKELDLLIPKSKEERNKENEANIDENLQSLLDNTAILYCAATGVRQENLASYIDNLDVEQSVGWLEERDSCCLSQVGSL